MPATNDGTLNRPGALQRPAFFVRLCLWLFTHTIYRIRIKGAEHVPSRGPALLVCNHISLVDGVIVAAATQRFVRLMVYRPFYETTALHWLFRLMKAIPISDDTEEGVSTSVERARQALGDGQVVCLFAESAISRTGHMLPFTRVFERIVDGLDVPIVPVCLDGLWGSIFSFKDGRFFWKWPERIPYPVAVGFGRPLPATTTAHDARQAILIAASEAAEDHPREQLHRRFVSHAKRRWFRFCMADSTGRELTYGRALVGSLLLSREIERASGPEPMVGVLLPASVGGALANVAVSMSGKVPVNLNFVTGREAMSSAMEQCGASTVLTSRVFLKKAGLEEMPGMVFLEELSRRIGPVRKVWTMAAAFVLPSRFVERLFIRGDHDPRSVATVIFSSGSTGTPKGVMLSHANIGANLEGMAQVFWVTGRDCLIGVLPFFHSFGFTATIWFPLLAGFRIVYHPNPTDAKTVGDLVKKYKATLLISTPTFCGAYLRKCPAEDFQTLRFTVVGAEKLSSTLATAFREKFGVELLEGYGCTEMAPVVAINVPDIDDGRVRQAGARQGTVGHPLPNVAVRIVDATTGADLPTGSEGLLLVRGPNRMLGYLGNPEKTREVVRDGWYVTGDIAAVDSDGFLRITDRLSRFSKIGGEMVPHIKVEETINRILGEQAAVVTAVPDEHKGERLVAFYTRRDTDPRELWDRLTESELPKLWIPKREYMFCIDAIPFLPTGKLDLRKVKAMALEATR